jgi:hypothetical protein
MYFESYVPTFWRNLLPPFSGWDSKQRMVRNVMDTTPRALSEPVRLREVNTTQQGTLAPHRAIF